MKKILLVFFSLFLLTNSSFGEKTKIIKIKGCVKYPLTLSLRDLKKFNFIEAQLNEVDRLGRYTGVFKYQEVPLKYLLSLAKIQKKDSDFNKPVDLAIVVKNKNGEKAILSWGEVFFRNPQNVILAYSNKAVYPHKVDSCNKCHHKVFYRSYLKILERPVGFPKLVVTNDFFTDRCLEDVVEIEVLDLKPKVFTKKTKVLFSSSFIIKEGNKILFKTKDLSKLKHLEYKVKVVGEGRGYNGINTYTGVSFKYLLKNIIKREINLNSVFLVSAPDGYRSLLSYGEIFLNPYGNRIMIADKINNKPIKKDGKFILIIPEDLLADRFVKAISKIEILKI